LTKIRRKTSSWIELTNSRSSSRYDDRERGDRRERERSDRGDRERSDRDSRGERESSRKHEYVPTSPPRWQLTNSDDRRRDRDRSRSPASKRRVL
jgi:hypothetical protein